MDEDEDEIEAMDENEIEALLAATAEELADETDVGHTAEELLAEADLARRIADYLELNGFANIADAAAKGWGDTRPLKIEKVTKQ
jgi:hypothetical protein